MKLSGFLKWAPLLALHAHIAQAHSDYTPILDSARSVERLITFDSLSGDLVYVPTAFDQTFHCLENNGVCSFQVYNRLTKVELSPFEETSRTGPKIVPLRADLFSTFVSIKDSVLNFACKLA